MTQARHIILPVDNVERADDITHLHEVCFPNCEVYGSDAPDSFWWLVFFGTGTEHPVGFGGIRCDYTTKVAYLCRAGVLPAHRGCGLQLRLIKARIIGARKRGMKTLVTDTIPGNYHSANNLIRAGFTLFNPATPWAGVEHSLFWRKEI